MRTLNQLLENFKNLTEMVEEQISQQGTIIEV